MAPSILSRLKREEGVKVEGKDEIAEVITSTILPVESEETVPPPVPEQKFQTHIFNHSHRHNVAKTMESGKTSVFIPFI